MLTMHPNSPWHGNQEQCLGSVRFPDFETDPNDVPTNGGARERLLQNTEALCGVQRPGRGLASGRSSGLLGV